MARSDRHARFTAMIVALAGIPLAAPTARAQTKIDPPALVAVSADVGRVQSSTEITVTVHLNMHGSEAFSQALQDIYTPGSPRYHRWMSNKDIARYAPTVADVQAVTTALASHGLSILSVSPDRLSIRARGPAARMERAFQTELHRFQRGSSTFRANVTPAHLSGAAGALVHGVTGLTNAPMKPRIKWQTNPEVGASTIKQSTTGFDAIATNDCFPGPSSVMLANSTTQSFGVFVGNTYVDGTVTCSWTPAQLQQHYGLDAAYARGLDGTGQTIVIVDGPADGDQLQSDLALFSSLSGLPAITPSSFTVVYPDGKPSKLALDLENWQDEASLDVEWAHAVAPGARIVIEILPSQDWDEFEYAIDYARQNGLGTVISNSYGLPETLFGAHTVAGFEQVLQTAAAAGIAVNFSSGDSGDDGTGSPGGGEALYPASSPYATSIGGTSIGIPNGTRGGAEVGWGNHLTILTAGGQLEDPPITFFLSSGSGGGASQFFAKPAWQQAVSGTMRQSPDIAALADPFTGVVVTEGGHEFAGAGGTSLACPMFSAIWAIAQQAAGGPLGQAAPVLYRLPAAAFNDVVPVSSPDNVEGIIVDSQGETFYAPNSLVGQLFSTTQYYSTLWKVSDFFYAVLSFGTDTSLTTTTGWDNVTGLGVPNGMSFIDAVVDAQ